MNVFGYSFFSGWKISCKFSKKGWEHWYNQSSIIAISVVMSFKLCKWIFMLQMNIHVANLYSLQMNICCKWIFSSMANGTHCFSSLRRQKSLVRGRPNFPAYKFCTFLSLMLKNLPESDCPTIYWSWWETKFVLWLTPLTKISLPEETTW